jgi:hypothetical protein
MRRTITAFQSLDLRDFAEIETRFPAILVHKLGFTRR